MGNATFSTSTKDLVAKGRGKSKLALDSPEAIQLLSDCNVAPSEVQCLSNGTPLINAWKTLVDGNEVTFCYSVKTVDNRTHIRDSAGNITALTPGRDPGRDKFIDNLLQQFLSQSSLIPTDSARSGRSTTEKYMPVREDVEAAYRMLAGQGQEISINALLKQVELNLANQGVVLEDDWQIKTEANIGVWSS